MAGKEINVPLVNFCNLFIKLSDYTIMDYSIIDYKKFWYIIVM